LAAERTIYEKGRIVVTTRRLVDGKAEYEVADIKNAYRNWPRWTEWTAVVSLAAVAIGLVVEAHRGHVWSAFAELATISLGVTWCLSTYVIRLNLKNRTRVSVGGFGDDLKSILAAIDQAIAANAETTGHKEV
jgi:hypothetical protein